VISKNREGLVRGPGGETRIIPVSKIVQYYNQKKLKTKVKKKKREITETEWACGVQL
jgi:hypothetical protein